MSEGGRSPDEAEAVRSCARCLRPIPPSSRFCGNCGASIEAATMPPLSIPSHARPELPERYEVVSSIGGGGGGRVFLCRDSVLEVPVAVKVLKREIARDEDAFTMMRKEAKAAARLRNGPGILSLYEFDRFRETVYIVMEYAPGGSLAARIRREGRLAEPDCLRIGLEVAQALGHAHDRGVIHRDIKPANILFDGEGRVKVADFGIAKIIVDATSTESSDTMMGTPAYMAPEALRQGKVDGRADLYSLGCVLFEAATGRLPFRGAFPDIIRMKLLPGAPVPDPRAVQHELSAPFAAIVTTLLQQDVERRFKGARSCMESLAGVLRAAGAASGPAREDRERSIEEARSLFRHGVRLQGRRAYDDAKARFKAALRLFEEAGEPRGAGAANALKYLARNYVFQGRYDRAETFFRKALAIREEALGTEHPEVAAELRYLGSILRLARRFGEAAQVYERARGIMEKSAGKGHPSLARILEHLARCRHGLGDIAGAESTLVEAMDLLEKTLGPRHWQVARILNNRAALALERSEHQKTEGLLLRSLDILGVERGAVHPLAPEALELYSILLLRSGRRKAAEEYWERALAMRAKVRETVTPE